MRPTAILRRPCAAHALLAACAAFAALGTTACSSPSSGSGRGTGADGSAASTPAAQRPAPTREAAHDLAYTETWEIRFRGELVGYLVEVLPTPDGVLDERAFSPGTALIEDRQLELIGFLSPYGTAYRFDAAGEAKPVGFGTRASNLSAFFRRTDQPELRTLTPGVVPGR